MSLTMQHIISDAQTLCTRLKDHESLADRLISQAQSLYKQVDAMKEYEEEVGQLNEVAHQKPREALVQGIQQENRHLRELQQENKELRNSLEEHQNTLEIVMSNYRKQVTQLMEMNKSDRQLQRGQTGLATQQQGPDTAMLDLQAAKIQEMALVMRRAVELDERSEHRAQEAIAQLAKENRGLRELLRVTYSYNSDLLPSPGPPLVSAGAADSSGSLPDSPCSQTVRRRAPADTPSGAGETHFQTVRRRAPATGREGERSAGAPAEGGVQSAAGLVGSPGKSAAERKTPSLGSASPVKGQAVPSPTKSPLDVKVPPVPTTAPPRLPSLAARGPAVTVRAAPVAVRSPPTVPAPAAPATAPASPPGPPAVTSPRGAAPPAGQSAGVASPRGGQSSPEQQLSPQKGGPVPQPAVPALDSVPAADPALKPAPAV